MTFAAQMACVKKPGQFSMSARQLHKVPVKIQDYINKRQTSKSNLGLKTLQHKESNSVSWSDVTVEVLFIAFDAQLKTRLVVSLQHDSLQVNYFSCNGSLMTQCICKDTTL